jgi:signal peptidase I
LPATFFGQTPTTSMLWRSFPSTKVPPGQLFVLGDNLNDSFDSRIEGFGPVSIDGVIGEPVMIYWSPDSARIACPIR